MLPARVALQEIDESLESPVPPRATHDVPKGAPIAKLNYMKAPSTDSIDLTPHATQEPIGTNTNWLRQLMATGALPRTPVPN
jgi:hypothetical protein